MEESPMPIEQRPQKVIADQLHDLANRVSDMETATDATQQADHYADLAGEISHRLETLQAELANEISRFKRSTSLPLRHLNELTEMLERSKVSDPPTLQLRDPADAPSAFKIAAQPETDVDFRQRLIDHVISPSVQDCEDMGWVTGAALDAIGLKYGLKRRGLSSDIKIGPDEIAVAPVTIRIIIE
jgi:hypothetical protein